LITVKNNLLRHPAVLAAGGALLATLLAVNVDAFLRGMAAPWLLGAVILTDMLVVSVSVAAALWAVAVWGDRSELSEARLAAIVESAMDPIIAVDEQQRIVLFNHAAELAFRCPREQALGAALERFIPQRFRGAHRAHIARFGETGVTNRRMDNKTTLWALRADGEEFPVEASISQEGEPGKRTYTAILHDITQRKRNEETLLQQQAERQELAARVLEAREDEKTRIARELHDELGQLLTALKMDLAWLRERLPAASRELGARAATMGSLLDQTVASTRRIAADLRPLMLDDLGLADAAAWLVSDFAGRSGVKCEIEISGDGAFAEMDHSVATAVYRALQESLTNIAKHAHATRAWVRLGAADGHVSFEVEDDGAGIGEGDFEKKRALGLKGMRERVTYFGGVLEVARTPHGGTRVRAQVPARPGGAA
jgi:PAS domain S-box-containing protein